MRMHRTEVRQLVPVVVLHQLPLDLREASLTSGAYAFLFGPAPHSDALGGQRERSAEGIRATPEPPS